MHRRTAYGRVLRGAPRHLRRGGAAQLPPGRYVSCGANPDGYEAIANNIDVGQARSTAKTARMVGQAVSNTNDAGRLAFGLRGCRDLLEKLRYETGSLNTTERHGRSACVL